MVSPTFGFSVGDFIAAIHVLNTIRQSLKDVGGSAEEYQQTIRRLDSLVQVLKELQSLREHPESLDSNHVIWQTAQSCQVQLQEFCNSQRKYSKTLAAGQDLKWSFNGAFKKAQWALSTRKDVEKLWLAIRPDIDTLSLSLAVHSRITNMNGHQEQLRLLRNVNDQIADRNLYSLADFTHSHLQRLVSIANENHGPMIRSFNDARENVILTGQHGRGNASQRLSAGSEQSISHLSFELVYAVWLRVLVPLFTNFISLIHRIPAAPIRIKSNCITIEDAFERRIVLPYEVFRSWKIIHAKLKDTFDGTPAASIVSNEQYRLYLLDNDPVLLWNQQTWEESVQPGTNIKMFLTLERVYCDWDRCPRPKCQKSHFAPCAPRIIKCSGCDLVYAAELPGFSQLIGQEQSTVSKRQMPSTDVWWPDIMERNPPKPISTHFSSLESNSGSDIVPDPSSQTSTTQPGPSSRPTVTFAVDSHSIQRLLSLSSDDNSPVGLTPATENETLMVAKSVILNRSLDNFQLQIFTESTRAKFLHEPFIAQTGEDGSQIPSSSQRLDTGEGGNRDAKLSFSVIKRLSTRDVEPLTFVARLDLALMKHGLDSMDADIIVFAGTLECFVVRLPVDSITNGRICVYHLQAIATYLFGIIDGQEITLAHDYHKFSDPNVKAREFGLVSRGPPQMVYCNRITDTDPSSRAKFFARGNSTGRSGHTFAVCGRCGGKGQKIGTFKQKGWIPGKNSTLTRLMTYSAEELQQQSVELSRVVNSEYIIKSKGWCSSCKRQNLGQLRAMSKDAHQAAVLMKRRSQIAANASKAPEQDCRDKNACRSS